jgi:DNA-directed RNA polymerases I, II, and III subunit RPABC1
MATLQKNNKFIINLYQIRNNILRMLSNRGYTGFIKKYYSDISFDEFQKLYSQSNIGIQVYKENTNNISNIIKTQCIVYFVDPTTKVGKVKQLFTRLMNSLEDTFDDNADIVNVIMIAQDKDINTNMNSIEKYVKSYQSIFNSTSKTKYKVKMELFYYSELSFNIIDHYLVPKHELMNKDEIKQLLIDMKCNKEQLPKIDVNDPISKYYGAEIGNVFRIYRCSPTSGISIYYRFVVEKK